MPKRLVDKFKGLFSSTNQAESLSPTIIPPEQHPVRNNEFSPNALKVLERITQAGYEAYLVGGCIRDNLLGIRPKDFDIATSAHPEEIREIFKNCRLIGRRFRLAHIRFGREIIEVATFRGGHKGGQKNRNTSHTSVEGLLLRDNVYGTLEEDAIRRDFTANSLYYRHTDGAIIDFVNGFDDIQDRVLKLIGPAEQRYREDPVRMLRAIRFSAKLGFTFNKETVHPIPGLAPLLEHVPPARLFEEVQKLFLAGHAESTWNLLLEYEMAHWLYPASVPENNNHPGATAMIRQAMINTDQRVMANKPVTPAFFYAVMLWGPLQKEWAQLKSSGLPTVPAFQKAIQTVAAAQSLITTIFKF